MTDIKFTQENKDKWLARLRDPNSKQCIGSGYNVRYGGDGDTPFPLDNDQPMCCLVHLEVVLTGTSSHASYHPFARGLIGDYMSKLLITKNDDFKQSLPQIADWIEQNIPAVEE